MQCIFMTLSDYALSSDLQSIKPVWSMASEFNRYRLISIDKDWNRWSIVIGWKRLDVQRVLYGAWTLTWCIAVKNRPPFCDCQAKHGSLIAVQHISWVQTWIRSPRTALSESHFTTTGTTPTPHSRQFCDFLTSSTTCITSQLHLLHRWLLSPDLHIVISEQSSTKGPYFKTTASKLEIARRKNCTSRNINQRWISKLGEAIFFRVEVGVRVLHVKNVVQ